MSLFHWTPGHLAYEFPLFWFQGSETCGDLSLSAFTMKRCNYLFTCFVFLNELQGFCLITLPSCSLPGDTGSSSWHVVSSLRGASLLLSVSHEPWWDGIIALIFLMRKWKSREVREVYEVTQLASVEQRLHSRKCDCSGFAVDPYIISPTVDGLAQITQV